MPLSHEYYITAFKTPVATAIPTLATATFTVVDFQAVLSNAYIAGPFSLIIDADASAMSYPLLIGVELRGVGKSISIGDRTHIAFAASSRHVITPASVPQLAYIDGTYDTIVVYCYSYAADVLNSRISLRIGPPVPISAPQPIIGRDTLVADPGVYFSSDGSFAVPAATSNVALWSILASTVSGLRFDIKSMSVTLHPTPSFAGDLQVRIELLTKFATTEVIHRVYSSDREHRTYVFNDPLIIRVGDTLRAFADNINTTNTYSVYSSVMYGTIY